jgi:hypothetical protein
MHLVSEMHLLECSPMLYREKISLRRICNPFCQQALQALLQSNIPVGKYIQELGEMMITVPFGFLCAALIVILKKDNRFVLQIHQGKRSSPPRERGFPNSVLSGGKLLQNDCSKEPKTPTNRIRNRHPHTGSAATV